MTKQDIINQVSSRASLSRVKAEEAVETVIELIKESLGHGEPVILRWFGTFQVRAKSKRVGRNPKTGEEAEISARKVVRFKSGKFFKQAVDEGEGTSWLALDQVYKVTIKASHLRSYKTDISGK